MISHLVKNVKYDFCSYEPLRMISQLLICGGDNIESESSDDKYVPRVITERIVERFGVAKN
jgi:hypothetical protein